MTRALDKAPSAAPDAGQAAAVTAVAARVSGAGPCAVPEYAERRGGFVVRAAPEEASC